MPGQRTGRDKEQNAIQGIVGILQQWGPQFEELITEGLVDDANSTTATLDAFGAGTDTFTGTSIDVTDFPAATVHVYSDVASAAGGLHLETSSDGTNWDHDHAYTIAAGVSRHIDRTLDAQYFRVRYVNGGTGQTTFRLQVKLHKNPPALHSHPLDHTLTADHQASLVRSVLVGEDYNVAGTYRNAQVFRTSAVDQVDALATLPVDVSGNPLTLYTEDDAHGGSGALGLAPMFVRRDTLTTLTPADGDWTPGFLSDQGALWVALTDSTGGIIETFAGTEYAHGLAVSVSDESSPLGPTLMMERDDQLSTLGVAAAGDWNHLRSTSLGALWVAIADGSGDPITTFGVAEADDADFTAGTTQGTPAMGVFESSPTSVTDGDLGIVGITQDRRQRGEASGDVAHNAADAGNPVKVGGYATDYEQANEEPVTADTRNVAEADRADLSMTLEGEVVTAVRRRWFEPTNVDTTYDGTTTTATSAAMQVDRYRQFCLQFDLEIENSPTDITIDVLVSGDGTNYGKLMNDGLGSLVYSATTIGGATISRAIFFEARCHSMQIRVTAQGTSGSSPTGDTFIMSNTILSAST